MTQPHLKNRHTALGMFIFAGGFTQGLKTLFDVQAHLEDGPFGVASSRLNHPEIPVHQDPKTWPLEDYRGMIDFIYGNPPCAPWSQAGMSPKQKRGLADEWYKQDPRTDCVHKMFHALKVIGPDVWAWETVARAFKAGRPMIDALGVEARELGYQTYLVLHNGVDCGLPQRRKRLFVVFSKVAIDWARPNQPHQTVRMAIGQGITHDPDLDVQPITPIMRELYDKVAAGGSFAITFNTLYDAAYHQQGKHAGRPGYLNRRLAWDTPSHTITGGAVLYHPEEPRLISVPEQAALCGYPRGFQFVGSRGDRYAQTAKAVTPPVGAWLGLNVKAALLANQRLTPGDPIVVDFLNKESA